MWRCNIIFLFITGLSGLASAQNVVFTAVAGANKIGVRDQVQVQYTITDAQNLQTVSRPASEDFAVVGGPYQQQSSQTTINNNKWVQTNSLILTYVLQPKHEGSFTIPPVVAKDGAGHTYQSNALSIQVVPGSVVQQQRRSAPPQDPFGGDDDVFAMMQRMQQQQMAALQQRRSAMQQQQMQQQQKSQPEDPKVNEDEINKDLFIRVVVDKNKVHVGEQITTSYKLYSRLAMQIGISKLPSLNGFWTQDFDIPKQAKPTEEVLNGKKYQVFLLKKSALFPQQTGTLELDPAEAKGMARIVQQVKRRMADMFADPFGAGTLMMNDPFFNNAFYNTMAYKDVEVHLKSTPVKITVTALPEKDKPAEYGGAVGNFTITSKLDKQELTTDDVATLTLNISGSGNIKLIEAPKPVMPNGLSTYDPQVIDTITGRSTTISGSKIITYVITPHTTGDYDIPAIPFTYFNTQTGTYETHTAGPFKLHVKPGKNVAVAQTGGNVPMKDLHDNSKKPLDKLVFNGKPSMYTATYWSMYALPVLTFLGLMVWKRRDDELSQDTSLLRRKRANRVALQRLATAKKLLQQENKKPFYEEISKAIWLYLSDKLTIPLSALSRDSATEAMNHRNVPDALQKKLENVIWECETALYASGDSKQMAHTYDEAIKVISDLEELFKA